MSEQSGLSTTWKGETFDTLGQVIDKLDALDDAEAVQFLTEYCKLCPLSGEILANQRGFDVERVSRS